MITPEQYKCLRKHLEAIENILGGVEQEQDNNIPTLTPKEKREYKAQQMLEGKVSKKTVIG